jgi:hypothetical protein
MKRNLAGKLSFILGGYRIVETIDLAGGPGMIARSLEYTRQLTTPGPSSDSPINSKPLPRASHGRRMQDRGR